MDRTVVIAVALGLGALLLWSLLILLEDMAGARRKKAPGDRPVPGRVAPRPPPRPVQWADSPPRPVVSPEPAVSPEYDDRFEQLVDKWFGEEPPEDDPWRRTA